MEMSSSEESHDELISQFCSITSCEPERGQFYLESANWNLQLAIQSFFEHSDDMSSTSITPQLQPRSAPNISEMLTNVSDDSSDAEMSAEPQPTPQPQPIVSESKSKKSAQPASRFATLDTLRAQQDSGASSDEEQGQAFYAGGSTRSGQQVLGPPRKVNTSDFVSDMFKSAKEHGAETVDPNEEHKRLQKLSAFSGSGFKLNSPIDQASAHSNVSAMKDEDSGDSKEVVLKFWKNGFSIDDGPLRTYDNPENQEFLASIRRGEIPRDLVSGANGRQIDLNMEDHKNEDFVQPRKKVQAFTGEAHRLGSPAAEFITSSILNSDPNDLKKCEQEAQNSLKVDDTQPHTNIQIRLSDGSRLVLKINLFRTIADIRQFICCARPAYAATPFVLMTTFPNKDLTDETLTIKEANLINASVVQRIV